MEDYTKEDIPSQCQRIFHTGHELPDEKTFASLGISKNYTLSLILRIGGGYSKIYLDACVDFIDVAKSDHDILI